MTPEEFWSILHSVPESAPIFYRAYYNDQGWVECYTMEDLPGNYIEVDQQIYVLAPHARVNNGKLLIVKSADSITKLQPGSTGTCCDPRDVCVVVDQETNIKWSVKQHETS